MRQLLLILALAFLFSSTVPAVFAEDKAPNKEKAKPNVILIMSDDQGWGQVGYMDHPHLKGKTPHFFRMLIQ